MALRPRAFSQPGKLSFLSPKASRAVLRPRALSSRSGTALEDELSCPVCCEIFREPVVLACSHSFCRACLQQFWNRKKARRECPVCRRKCSLTEPTISLALKNVAETFLKEQQQQQGATGGVAVAAAGGLSGATVDARCDTHGETLKLYCEDDGEVICCVCQTSKKHQGHSVCPLEEAAEDLKEELRTGLVPLKKSLRHLYEAKQKCEDQAVHIKNQSQAAEQHVRGAFEELRAFLQREESARLQTLRAEHEDKSLLAKKRADNLTKDILALSHAIIAVENETASGDAPFLQNYNDTKKRAQISVKEPDVLLPQGALMDVPKHISSLKYQVWEKMMEVVQHTPVTLDPNTAYSWLTLSGDLTSVANSGSVQELPDNPERFSTFVFVLGSEGFTAGRHAWEVEVGDKVDWMLGVVKESVSRKGRISGCPEGGFWMISHSEGEYEAMTRPGTPLAVAGGGGGGGLTRVRVQLDYEAGEVVFSDPIRMAVLHTFHDFFTERMFPFFCPGANINGNNPRPLRICPSKVAVWNSSTW